MSNNYRFWGKRFGYWNNEVPKGQKEPWGWCMGTSGNGAKPRTNKGNPNTAQSKQSKRDKERYQRFVKLHGLPVKYYRSNGKKDHERNRTLPNIKDV